MMCRLREARKKSKTADGITIHPLTPREKRVLVTKAIGQCHEDLMKTNACERAFIATATWLPVSHLERDSGPAFVPEESQVKLQHLPEYKYTEQCPRNTVLAVIAEKKRQEEEKRIANEQREAKEKAEQDAAIAAMAPYVEKATTINNELEELIHAAMIDEVTKISEGARLKKFVIGGSRASAAISDAYSTLTVNDKAIEIVPLGFNDVDVFHGTFTDDTTKRLVVNKSKIKKFSIDGVTQEVNTVECGNLSPATFLQNNDINITASCILVDFSSNECVLSIHASPSFWTFLFQDHAERKIQTVNTINTQAYEATTCIRIAYKAFELTEFDLKFSIDNIDPMIGTIASSQKEKMDRMEDWMDNPFKEYKCKKCRSYFVIVKKHNKTVCSAEGCTSGANKNCGHKMCKKCCVKHVNASGKKSACKLKSHKATPTTQGTNVLDDNNVELEEEEDVNEEEMHDEMDDGDTDEKENGRDDEDDNDNDDNVLELPTLGEDENEWDGHSV